MTSEPDRPAFNLDGTPKDPRRPGRPQKNGARHPNGHLIRRHRVDDEYHRLVSAFRAPPPKDEDGRLKRHTLTKRMALFAERYAVTLEPLGSAMAAGYAISKAADTARWLLTLPLVRQRILELRPDAFEAEEATDAMAADQDNATFAAILEEGRRRVAALAEAEEEGRRQHEEAVAANRTVEHEPEPSAEEVEADRAAAARVRADAARFRAVMLEPEPVEKPKRYRTPSPIADAVVLVKPDRQKSRQPEPATPWQHDFVPPDVAILQAGRDRASRNRKD